MAVRLLFLALVLTFTDGQPAATLNQPAAAAGAAGTAGAAGAAGAAGTAAAGAGAASSGLGVLAMQTIPSQHPFCDHAPSLSQPKMPIFHMTAKSGFYNGYRLNQTVVVEITAKYPQVWRINQFFVHVPENNPHFLSPQTRVGYVAPTPKQVGHWTWNLQNQANQMFGQPQDPTVEEMGGSQPIDCGGAGGYGPFNMLSPIGAHAAMQIPQNNNPGSPHKGWSKVEAKWVPPSDWRNIVFRKTITIQAYVTFEKIPPGPNAQNYHHHYGFMNSPRQSRWVKKEITLLNLDYIDVHKWLQPQLSQYRMMQQMMSGGAATPII